mgnify:CR=1 FL=1
MLMNTEIYKDEYNNSEKINNMLHYLSEMLTSRMQFNMCTHEEMEKQFIDNYAASQTSYKDDNYNISVYVTMEKLKNKTTFKFSPINKLYIMFMKTLTDSIQIYYMIIWIVFNKIGYKI